MKQTIQRLCIMATLLIAVLLTASAQDGISAKLQNDGHTLKFSATGFTVTKQGKPKIDKMNSYTHYVKLEIEGTVEVGAKLNAVLEKISGKNDPGMCVRFAFLKEGDAMAWNTFGLTQLEREIRMMKEFTVTDKMINVYIDFIYRTPDPTPNSKKYRGETQVTITLHVKEKPQPLPPLAIECDVTRVRGNNALHEYETIKYKDCGVRFRDITGDVSWRHCDDDDVDGWESAEFDTILHYLDLIKTGVDSEAILGLADKTSYTIGEKTILQLPPYEGPISLIKMMIGVAWLNMKKTVNGGELRLDGSQAVAGIRGTIVAMKETGRETSVWLFAGKVDVTSRKTGRKITLKPGQMAVTNINGETQVKKFDITQGAKKFKIPMSEIENHYVGQEFTDGRLTYRILKGNNVEVKGIKKGETCKQIQILDHAECNGTTYKVVAIAKKAFANQTQLVYASIPTSVRSIGEDAFLNTALEKVIIMSDNISIVKHAFRNCKKLTTVTIKGKNPKCSPDAFVGCSTMKELQIRDIKPSNNGKKLNGTNAVIKVIK